ncbi:TPA: hypothetical protein ROG05_000112 [Enterobacter soli]|nr:hypothetical protein [Enterobacter soli]
MKNEEAAVTWWEKTVEYNFVSAAKDEFRLNLLAPFAGNPESIGDAVVGANSRFFIIEFKRTLSDFTSEIDKYINGDEGIKEARNFLNELESSKYHYIIAGDYTNGSEKLNLIIRRYFNAEEEIDFKPHEFFAEGMSDKQLEYYTEFFTKFKNRDTSSEDSDSQDGNGKSQSCIIGIDENRKAVMLSVSYYAKLKASQKKKPKF